MNKSARLSVAFGATALVLFLAGCTTRAQTGQEVPETPVRVVKAVLADRAIEIRSVGTLNPSTVVPLSFKIGGPVSTVSVDVGDRVRKGQLLASLHTDEIDAAVAQAEASLAKAIRDATRMRNLYADSVVTLAQLQDAETGLEVARAQAASAEFNRAYADIHAPAAGRVLSREIESGQLISPGTRVLSLGVDGGWSVFSNVTDMDVVSLQIGDRADLVFDAFRREVLEGHIVEIAETPEPQTGTYEIEIGLEKADARLRSGFVARVRLYPSTSDRYTLVPSVALVRAEGTSGTLFVANPQSRTAEARTVVIAGLLDSDLALQSGVTAGEQVITDGASYLVDGAGISIQN